MRGVFLTYFLPNYRCVLGNSAPVTSGTFTSPLDYGSAVFKFTGNGSAYGASCYRTLTGYVSASLPKNVATKVKFSSGDLISIGIDSAYTKSDVVNPFVTTTVSGLYADLSNATTLYLYIRHD